MRIGFDGKRYFHNNTGLGNYSRALVTDIALEDPDSTLLLLDNKAQCLENPQHNVQLIKPKRNGLFWRQIGISNDIEKNKIDIYHGLSAELPLSRPRDCKLVVTIHDVIFLKYPEYYRFIDRLIYTYKLRHALLNADSVICSSEKTAKDVLKIFPRLSSKIEVIYQSCNPIFYQRVANEELEKFRKDNKLPNKFLLCVSKFERRKNHKRLLEAYFNIRESHPLPLVLVGRKGDTFEEISTMVNKHGFENKVFICTEVSIQELHCFYQLATWSIFPSEYEGFGIPAVESLASGTPVLTTLDSSMSEITGDFENLFDPLSIHSIENILVTSLREEVIQNNIESIPQRLAMFSSQTIANQHITLYKSLLKC